MRYHMLDPKLEAMLEEGLCNSRGKLLTPEQERMYKYKLEHFGEDEAWIYWVCTLNDHKTINIKTLWDYPETMTLNVFKFAEGEYQIIPFVPDWTSEARRILENCYDIKTHNGMLLSRPTFATERFDLDTLDSRFHEPPAMPEKKKGKGFFKALWDHLTYK